MNATNQVDFAGSQYEAQPFPHFYVESLFNSTLEATLLTWLEKTEIWQITKTDFYEQYEFSLLGRQLPAELACLLEDDIIDAIRIKMQEAFEASQLELIGATIHKLIDGQRIGVHNDFIGKEESHRLIIQINNGWAEEYGGYLMLFNSANAEDINKLVIPVSNSAFGFQISETSNHAVSTVYNFSRYTLVYTFKQKD